MKLDICIPAHNEEDIIVESALSIARALRQIPDIDYRIVVVDNGSTDRTAEKARTIKDISVLSIQQKGKGAAVIAAARSSDADVFGFIDADLSADPMHIAELLSHIVRETCDIAIGSRLIDTDLVERESIRTFLSRTFNVVRRAILGISVRDTQCGLKLMNAAGRDTLAKCTETGWFFDVEFLALAHRSNLRVSEIAVRWDEHTFPHRKSRLRLVRDGFGAAGALIRIRRRMMLE